MKILSLPLVIFALLALEACAPSAKSGVDTKGDGMIDVTDRSTCGAPTANAAPLVGTSWSQTLRWKERVTLKRSLSFTGATITARQKATEILTGRSESLRSVVQPNGDQFTASEFTEADKTLTLQDGSTFTFAFDRTVGTIHYARTGNCLTVTNGKETVVLVPEL